MATKTKSSTPKTKSTTRKSSSGSAGSAAAKRTASVANDAGKALAVDQTVGGRPDGVVQPKNAVKPREVVANDSQSADYPEIYAEDQKLVVKFGNTERAFDHEGALVIQRRVQNAIGNL